LFLAEGSYCAEAGLSGVALTAHSPAAFARSPTVLHRTVALRPTGLQLCSGGEMLLKIGLVLLVVWLLGIVGVYRLGQNVHFFLLVGLMLLLLGFLKARDAAGRAS
jgi:hypothetical protein